MKPRLHQVAILVLAGLASALYLHWLLTQPLPLAVPMQEVNFWVGLLFRQHGELPVLSPFLRVTLALMAVTGLASCALASVLAIRLPGKLSTRRLSWALVLASLSAAYLFFATTHAQYRALLGWSPTSPTRFILDLLAYAAGLLAPLYLTRFFMSYPRVLSADDIAADALRWRKERRAQPASASNWRAWLYPDWLRRRLTNAEGERHLLKLPSDEQNAQTEARLFRVMQSRGLVVALLLWALACAVVDSLVANPAFAAKASDKDSVLSLLQVVITALWFVTPAAAWDQIGRCLRLYSRNASPEDRRRIDWIKSTLVTGGFLILFVELLSFAVLPFTVKWLGDRGIWLRGEELILGPMSIPLQLVTLAFVIALALSIFYRGAVDPRLMARKVSMYGLAGTLFAVVFVLLERTVAMKIVAALNLAPDTGAMLAFVGVAITAVPLKKQADKAVNALLGRWLPLDSMIAGERRSLVVALSDLSGYTRLSSEDEKQALLLAALLQRQSATLVKAHGGRIVKSMGDAVMLAFDEAGSALHVLEGLHRNFPRAAEQLGLTQLPVHSGAHLGEVTVAHDGDIYGQTVNIAARIQGSAAPGQIVVSAVLAAACEGARFKDLGARQFKNVPDPIPCLELSGDGSP